MQNLDRGFADRFRGMSAGDQRKAFEAIVTGGVPAASGGPGKGGIGGLDALKVGPKITPEVQATLLDRLVSQTRMGGVGGGKSVTLSSRAPFAPAASGHEVTLDGGAVERAMIEHQRATFVGQPSRAGTPINSADLGYSWRTGKLQKPLVPGRWRGRLGVAGSLAAPVVGYGVDLLRGREARRQSAETLLRGAAEGGQGPFTPGG
jgi:hypothetical protein